MEKEIKKIKYLAQASFNYEMGFVSSLDGVDSGYTESIHGIKHWEKVRENGETLSIQKGVDSLVVTLFAYLHDCKRRDDGQDAEHGQRAAKYVNKLSEIGELNFLSVSQLEKLVYACENHHLADTSEDPTIGACYDADRLELVRVGINPKISLMNTPLGKYIAKKMQQGALVERIEGLCS